MIPSLLTVCFFSIGSVIATKAARYWGEHRANLIRIIIAAMLLGVWAFGFGKGLTDKSNVWFFFSGVIGFGIGDTGYFMSLTRIGAQLTSLMTLCLSALIAAVLEFFWMGTPLTTGQLCSGGIIICGVSLVVLGRPKLNAGNGSNWGYLWGLVAALGQGCGAVLSRKGYMVAELNTGVDFGTAAFERVVGGVLFILLIYICVSSRKSLVRPAEPNVSRKRKYIFIFLVAVCGPILGVSCFQWALSIAPGGVVLPLVSMTPIMIIPFAYFLDKEIPTKRSLQGGVVAVVGTMMMAYFGA